MATDPMFPLRIPPFLSVIAVPYASKRQFTVAELGTWAASSLPFARVRFTIASSGSRCTTSFFAWRSLTAVLYLVPLFALGAAHSLRIFSWSDSSPT